MTDGLTMQKPNAVRAIMGQVSCRRCHGGTGNVEESG